MPTKKTKISSGGVKVAGLKIQVKKDKAGVPVKTKAKISKSSKAKDKTVDKKTAVDMLPPRRRGYVWLTPAELEAHQAMGIKISKKQR